MIEVKIYDLVVSIVVYKPKLQQLQETLDSLSKTPLKIKVILFDNSPTSLSQSSYSCQHPVTYIFNNKNLGYGRAHNKTMQKFLHEAKYFLILNPDVFFDRNLLPQLLLRMAADASIGLCIPQICHPEGTVQLVNRRIPRPQDYVINFINGKMQSNLVQSESHNRYLLKDVNIQKPFICPTISGCFMFFRAQALHDVGGFDERYFLYLEDTDLSRRVAERYKTVVFSDLSAHHYWTRGAYKNTKLFMMFVRNLVRYFNKWGWVFDKQREHLNSRVQYYVAPFAKNTLSTDSVLKNQEIFDSFKENQLNSSI